MKILLINPPYYSNWSAALSYGEPLGLAYLAAAIQKDAKHEVEILDAIGMCRPNLGGGPGWIGLSVPEVLARMSRASFDAIGVTLTNWSGDDATEEINAFLSTLKRAHPRVPLIIGGPEVTLEWETYSRNADVDYLVLGDGEKTILDLLDALSSGNGAIQKVPGIVYRDTWSGEVIKTRPQPPIDSLDSLPLPARHLLPMENYFRYRPAKYYLRPRAASMLTSRACPYDCAFCNLIAIQGRTWKARSPKSVVDEMSYLVERYGVQEFHIQDSNFMVKKDRVEAICDEIIRRKLDINILVQPGLQVSLLTKDLVLKLKKAGLYILCAQVESGNHKTVKYIEGDKYNRGKPIDLNHARDIMKYANSVGLWTQTNIIIGFQFESREDIEESIRVAETLHVDQINYVHLQVLPHTRVWNDYSKAGLIPERIPGKKIPFENPVSTSHISTAEIMKIEERANRNHKVRRTLSLLNPVTFATEMFPKLKHPDQIRYFLRRILT